MNYQIKGHWIFFPTPQSLPHFVGVKNYARFSEILTDRWNFTTDYTDREALDGSQSASSKSLHQLLS